MNKKDSSKSINKWLVGVICALALAAGLKTVYFLESEDFVFQFFSTFYEIV